MAAITQFKDNLTRFLCDGSGGKSLVGAWYYDINENLVHDANNYDGSRPRPAYSNNWYLKYYYTSGEQITAYTSTKTYVTSGGLANSPVCNNMGLWLVDEIVPTENFYISYALLFCRYGNLGAKDIPVVRISIRGQAFEGSAVTTSVTLGVLS
jgi:hypothetical protein